MFPTRYCRNQAPWLSVFPGMKNDVFAVARAILASAGTREPRAARRNSGRELANHEPVVKIFRRAALMVAAAGVLAGSTTMAADSESPALDLVKQVTSSIIQELDSQGELLRDDTERAFMLSERLVLPYLDVERMARRVLGKRWRAATPEQQTRFVSAFRTMLVRTYALVLHEYRGQTLTYLDPVPRKKDDEIVIPVRIEVAAAIRCVSRTRCKGQGRTGRSSTLRSTE